MFNYINYIQVVWWILLSILLSGMPVYAFTILQPTDFMTKVDSLYGAVQQNLAVQLQQLLQAGMSLPAAPLPVVQSNTAGGSSSAPAASTPPPVSSSPARSFSEGSPVSVPDSSSTSNNTNNSGTNGATINPYQ